MHGEVVTEILAVWSGDRPGGLHLACRDHGPSLRPAVTAVASLAHEPISVIPASVGLDSPRLRSVQPCSAILASRTTIASPARPVITWIWAAWIASRTQLAFTGRLAVEMPQLSSTAASTFASSGMVERKHSKINSTDRAAPGRDGFHLARGHCEAESVARVRDNVCQALHRRGHIALGEGCPGYLRAIAQHPQLALRSVPDGRCDRSTAAEVEGYAAFKSFGCVSCHQGANVGGNMYQRSRRRGATRRQPMR